MNEGKQVVEKLKLLLDNKNAVRDALYYKGVTDVTNVFSTYGDLVRNLGTANIGYSVPKMYQTEQPEASVDNTGASSQSVKLIYVSPYGDDDYNDGASWETAYKSLQKAISIAKYSVIYVMNGTYTLDSNIKIASGKSGIKIYGGFYKNNPTWENRNPFAYMSVFDAKHNNYGVTNSQSMFSTPENINVLIDGICIANGEGENYSAFYSSTNFCVRNCLAINCKQISPYDDRGAGFHGIRKNVFYSCLALNCVSQTIGGGFRINTYDIVEDCFAIECKAATFGGGFYISSKSVGSSMKNCCASGCFAGESGGGFYIDGSGETFNMQQCVALSCRADNGAGFYNESSNSLFYKNCVCFNCESKNSIMYINDSSLINCSVFSNMILSEYGYPIYVNSGYSSKIYNVLAVNNYYYSELRTYYFVNSDGVDMKKCAGDIEGNFSGEDYLLITSGTNIFTKYLPYYWYLPVGYKVIDDFQNKYFGDFVLKDSSLKSYGYIEEGVTPTVDFNGDVRETMSVGAFN